MTLPGYDGPAAPQLVLVGEAFGEAEDVMRLPFVGSAGQELWRMLGLAVGEAPGLHAEAREAMRFEMAWVRKRNAWLEATGIGFTNVFALRPPDNDLAYLCVGAKDPNAAKHLGELLPGKYLHDRYLPELDRLADELTRLGPKVVVPLGNTALWALMATRRISALRGTFAEIVRCGPVGTPTLPTYHPAAILRQWDLRLIAISDLGKAWRGTKNGTERPERFITIAPTLAEMAAWQRGLDPASVLAVDIETAKGQITCVGFADSRSRAITVPFWDKTRPDWSYWPDAVTEAKAWDWVWALLRGPNPKVFQNGLYDIQYLLRMGIAPANCAHDTMLRHHSMFPEMQKGLGFLGSVYTDEPAWKNYRNEKPDVEKKDD